ncbi:MAG: hypothetical protein U9O54_01230 [Chloroflexota bacterium]|nr:hypothetical protein [Chloroflexota bacterium]
MMGYAYWGAIAVLIVFVVLSIYDVFVMRFSTRSGIDDFVASEQVRHGLSQRLGGVVLSKLPFLDSWQAYLTWAHLDGKLMNWSLPQVVFVSLILGVLGFVLASLSPVPIVKLAPLIVAVYPFLRVKTIGESVKKSAERTLPETAALIAAELSAGSSVEDAIARASRLPGPLSRILDMAVDQATNEGRPLTAKGSQEGVLKEVLSGMGLPALRGFAVQLDMVARSGVAPARRMQEISNILASEYRQRVHDGISTLDKKLTLAVVLFYFAPFFLILLIGTFGAAISSF